MTELDIKNKKLAGIDFGRKRIGIAVCDIFHIAVRPLANMDYTDENFWQKFVKLLESEDIQAAVVGVPYRSDGENNGLIADIDLFVETLQQKTSLSVYKYDEYFSSKEAGKKMIEAGVKKSKRREKGILDSFAAAVILRNFLDERES